MQRRDNYAFVNNIAQYVETWNEALGESWAVVAAINGLVADDQHFVARVDGGKHLRLMFPDYLLWSQQGAADNFKLFINVESLAILAGWPTRLQTRIGVQ